VPRFRRAPPPAPFGAAPVRDSRALALAACSLTVLSAIAVWYFFRHGFLQWYGDAEAHLNNARRLYDSLTPGYDQLGTPWLPLPHLAILPFTRVDGWWHSRIAAAFPAAVS